MMDIEGLINDSEQSGLHIATNPFALPTSSNSMNPSISGGGPSSASSDRADAATLAAFAFPTTSATLAENSEFSHAFQVRKRSSDDVVDEETTTATDGPRTNPPGRKKSQTRGDAVRISSAKDYPRRRALQACQICRARKTKCDNERPRCGSCQVLGVECNYNEAPTSKSPPAFQTNLIF